VKCKRSKIKLGETLELNALLRANPFSVRLHNEAIDLVPCVLEPNGVASGSGLSSVSTQSATVLFIFIHCRRFALQSISHAEDTGDTFTCTSPSSTYENIIAIQKFNICVNLKKTLSRHIIPDESKVDNYRTQTNRIPHQRGGVTVQEKIPISLKVRHRYRIHYHNMDTVNCGLLSICNFHGGILGRRGISAKKIKSEVQCSRSRSKILVNIYGIWDT
ncbi:hypothetical protein PRIPAC_73502, partial [Pristionchus pacificus]|uniref:Uncharacterized protein n=1 Tax=Pristionchus pacificus TaxID=54126 RepID=A0A2A6CGN3_PRIPA